MVLFPLPPFRLVDRRGSVKGGGGGGTEVDSSSFWRLLRLED